MLIPIISLLVIVLAIFGLNFEPATWLSGWDNLHPEFNFALNLSRSFFGVWQEYQGLGLLGGMGHASDFFRQIFLWLISIILPSNFSRYFFHFLMLFVGSTGILFLLKEKLLRTLGKENSWLPALAGAIFYIFNLGTLQMFYVPFEAYSASFAFLPWLFYSVINYSEKKNGKSFIFFILINLLATSQGYVATIFLVYFGFLVIYLLYDLLSKKSIKTILIVLLTTIAINLFWLLPNLYFFITNVNVNLFSKINEMATEDNLLKNLSYGNLKDTAILKGFLFDSYEFNKEGNSVSIFVNWYKFTKSMPFLFIGYAFFFSIILGIFFAIKKKIKILIPFIFILVISFILLSNNTFGFALIDQIIFKIPLFAQIFRFPFTKFAIILAFTFSIFYSCFVTFVSESFKKKLISNVFAIIFCLLPILYLYPIFQGNFFYEKETTKIPNEYFQVFDYFKNQNSNTRIANLPQSTYWGWSLYKFNYSGSGFVWYGIPQSILDRAFDVWSNNNENYYWEMSYAIYSKNRELFEKVLEKYQINWLLVDGNIINPSSPKALYLNELGELINSSFKTKNVANFGNIKIYEVNLENKTKDYVFLNNYLANIQPTYQWNNYDQAFSELSNYRTYNTEQRTESQTIYYPFRSLFTNKRQEDLEFKISETDNEIIFESIIPKGFENHQLSTLNNIDELYWINSQNLGEQKVLKPEAILANNQISVEFPKIEGYYYGNFLPGQIISKDNPQNCNQFTKGVVQNQLVDKYWLRLGAIDANNCSASFWFPNLSQSLSYLIKVESRYQEGKSLLFWLENLNSQKADLETYLPKSNKQTISYFVQPPMTIDGLGYTLHFDNISIGSQKSVNDLGKVSIYQIPWKYLTSLKLIPSQEIVYGQNSLPQEVIHPNPSFYEIKIKPQTQTLILSQSFDKGWLAYDLANSKWQIVNSRLSGILTPLIGKKIDNHFLVNNWENGWQLNGEEKIALIYWPQYLEYFGFLLLFSLITFLVVSVIIKK